MQFRNRSIGHNSVTTIMTSGEKKRTQSNQKLQKYCYTYSSSIKRFVSGQRFTKN